MGAAQWNRMCSVCMRLWVQFSAPERSTYESRALPCHGRPPKDSHRAPQSQTHTRAQGGRGGAETSSSGDTTVTPQPHILPPTSESSPTVNPFHPRKATTWIQALLLLIAVWPQASKSLGPLRSLSFFILTRVILSPLTGDWGHIHWRQVLGRARNLEAWPYTEHDIWPPGRADSY